MSIPCEGLNSLPSLKNDDISSNPKSSPNSIDALSVVLRTPIVALCSCFAAIVLSYAR